MSDAQAPSLSDQILAAPEPMWKKLRPALGVATREEAAQLVMRDEKAAAVAISILNPVVAEEQGSVLTQPRESSVLTARTPAAAPVGKKRMKF
jgi:hypothetical protein